VGRWRRPLHACGKVASGLVILALVSGCSTNITQESIGIPEESLPVSENQTVPSGEPEPRASSIDPELFAKLKADEDKAWGRDEESSDPGDSSTNTSVEANAPVKEVEQEEIVASEAPETEEITTLELAYNQVARLFDSSYTNVSNSIIAHESIEQYIVNDISGYLSDAISTWDEDYGVFGFDVIVFRQDSAAWADEVRTANGHRLARGSFVEDVKISSQGEHCGFAYVFPGAVYLCISNSGANIDYLDSVVAHEYFHTVQNELGIDHTNLPIWIGEGSAAFLGDAHQFTAKQIYQKNSENYNHKMLSNFGYAKLKDLADHITIDQVRTIYTKLENGSDEKAQSLIAEYNAYLFGSIAIQNLIGTYSYDEFMGFIESVGAGTYWKTAFVNTYGITTDEFYSNMLTYIQKTY
jgi:hypothetical protein